MNPADAPSSITAAHALVATLVEHGVRDVVLAPGSRSAPLAYALADAADSGVLRLHVRIDERCAGFLALGLAKGRPIAGVPEPQAPVAIVTTSGTAAANLLPALLEAHHSEVPLLALTADRPHELRGTGANQTTDQVNMFGSAVRFAADVPAPSGLALELTDLVSLAARAVAATTGARTGHPGPAHLNLSFRDPLAPLAAPITPEDPRPQNSRADATMQSGAGSGLRSTRTIAAPGSWSLTTPVNWPLSSARTVLVAGSGAGPIARELAERRGWPLLAESVSGSMGGPNQVLAHAQVLLHGPVAREVERVVVLGRPTLSRPVQQMLARAEVEVLVIAPGAGQWPDAARNATAVLPGIPAHWLSGETCAGQAGGDAPDAPGPDQQRWLDRWLGAGRAVAEAVQDEVARGLSGPRLAHELAAVLKPTDTLVIGSSNPVRDLDLVADWPEPPRIVSNRGLAGIDGLISTATGVALATAPNGTAQNRTGQNETGQNGTGADDATGMVVRVLIGDLTFLHDVGGLLRAPGEPEPNLQIIVANDRGGSIFAGLEHGALGSTNEARARTFERVFSTPHIAQVAALCVGYGITHTMVDDAPGLTLALKEPAQGVSVLEVVLDRSDRREATARLTTAVRAALGSLS